MIRFRLTRGEPGDHLPECTGENLVLSTITAQIAQRPQALVVDLRQITFFGSAGIRVLGQAHADAQREGTRLAIVANQRLLLRTLAITQVDKVLDVYRNAFEALADIALNSY
ncbi:STAS domain-containing protein [Lentzea sp. NBRC 105346]|uniref:STAS domain-containing protein n=1 Tax=Lentzea sp. NBRC 105346 TaxID=3032205 RepID=UPI0025528BB8|nr:STAS domain-containing protein [Lentzea sp. NBRC 105346]